MSNEIETKVDIYSGDSQSADYVIAVVTAAKAGKRIQYRKRGNAFASWQTLPQADSIKRTFNWTHYVFRVDPFRPPEKESTA